MVKHFHTIILTAYFVIFGISWLRAAEVSATLDANQIATGEAAILSIKISGGRAVNQPTIPEIPNLMIHFGGQNSMMSVINGRMESSQTFSYAIGSQTPGTYTVPALTLTVDGQAIATEPLTLSVTGPALTPNQQKPQDPDSFGTLTVQLAQADRSDIYLTEIAPVIIHAAFPADTKVELRSGIQPEGKGFTLHNLSDQAQQSQEMRDGKPYVIVTWVGGISATKAGKIPLSLSVKIIAATPDARQPSLRLHNSPRQIIGGGYQKKEITLRTKDQEIDVLPLPTAGKPADFSGAVGDFQFDGIAIPETWKTGEPQHVTLRVKGSGNFAIMQAPPLTPLELWKTYPGLDQFTAGDRASFSGNKIFQYNAIPRKAGTLPVSFTLHYFDPKKRAYQSIQSPAKNITITGADFLDEPKAPLADAASTPPKDNNQPTLAPPRTRNNRVALLAQLSTDTNPTPLFLAATALSAAIPLLAFFLRRYKNPARQAQRQRQREITAAVAQTEHAIRQADIAAYFQAARATLQLPLAAKWQVQAHAITLHDVATRCGTDSPITAFFREADTATYGRQTPQTPWETWRSLYQQALIALQNLTA